MRGPDPGAGRRPGSEWSRGPGDQGRIEADARLAALMRRLQRRLSLSVPGGDRRYADFGCATNLLTPQRGIGRRPDHRQVGSYEVTRVIDPDFDEIGPIPALGVEGEARFAR